MTPAESRRVGRVIIGGAAVASLIVLLLGEYLLYLFAGVGGVALAGGVAWVVSGGVWERP